MIESVGFIKLSRSERTQWLLENHPNAFLLLTAIALRARRTTNSPDGYHIGECHIGDYKKCGLPSEKAYRTAKNKLVKLKLIEIIETCRSRNVSKYLKGRPKSQENARLCQNGATERATYGTKVKLLNSEFYDINPEDKGDRKGDIGATEGRPKGDEQEEKNERKKEDHHPLTPSSFDDELIDDFSFQENLIEVVDGVRLSPSDLEDCIHSRGTLDNVKIIIKQILQWKDREHPIRNWPETIKTWKISRKAAKEKIIAITKMNEDWAKYYVEEFGSGHGWRCQIARCEKRDARGLLFSSGYESEMIYFTDNSFKEKVDRILREKKMITKNN